MADSPAHRCLVSVIVPVYNGEKIILQALQSVFDQKLEDCEILVVNDGSTDQTAAVLAQFNDHPQVRLLSHPGGVNRSAAASRKLAIKEARGEFLAFVDADDEFLPGKLARHLQILRDHPHVLLVHGPVVLRIEGPPEPHAWTFNLGDKAEIYDLPQKSYFLRRNMICNSTVICRRSAVLPDDDMPANMIGQAEDWVLWNCVAFRGLFYYDPEPLTQYAYHPASFTNRVHQKPGAVELTAIEFYLTMLPRLPNLSMRLRALFGLLYYLNALFEIRRRQPEEPGPLRQFLLWVSGRRKGD